MSRTATAMTLAAVLVTLLVLVPAGLLAVGTAAIAAGLFPLARKRRSQPLALAGAGALLGGVVVAATNDLPVGLILLATVAALLAWDTTAQAISLRQQIDDGEIRRALLAHVGATLAATSLVAAVTYLSFLFAGAVPPVAVVLFLVGAVLLVVALEPQSRTA